MWLSTRICWAVFIEKHVPFENSKQKSSWSMTWSSRVINVGRVNWSRVVGIAPTNKAWPVEQQIGTWSLPLIMLSTLIVREAVLKWVFFWLFHQLIRVRPGSMVVDRPAIWNSLLISSSHRKPTFQFSISQKPISIPISCVARNAAAAHFFNHFGTKVTYVYLSFFYIYGFLHTYPFTCQHIHLHN